MYYTHPMSLLINRGCFLYETQTHSRGNFPFSMGDFQQPHLLYPNTLLFHWITKPFCPELSCPWDLSFLLYAFAPWTFILSCIPWAHRHMLEESLWRQGPPLTHLCPGVQHRAWLRTGSMWVSDSFWPYRSVACQAPLSMGFSRQEYWSGLPCLPYRGSSRP